MKILIIILFALNTVIAQTTANASMSVTLIPVTRLDLNNRTTFSLSLVAPTEAGNQLSNTATNNGKWLNFTSAVAPGVTRRITGHISGTIPPGINVNLALSAASGSGSGARGTPVATTTFTNSAQTIINGIAGAITGNKANGYQLTYSLSIADYSLMRSNSTLMTIVYTIIDN